MVIGKWISEERNQRLYQIQWKRRYNIPQIIEHNQSNAKRKIDNTKYPHKEIEEIPYKQLGSTPENSKTERVKDI